MPNVYTLPPKVESYELSVQAGRGHSLNVSLFERLVEAGMPHKSLAVQHRMHPDISQLVKHTYPALQVSRMNAFSAELACLLVCWLRWLQCVHLCWLHSLV